MQQNFANLVFYILQGSAATHLRRGGKYGTGFIANFMENTTVKEFWISANICQSYERMYSGTVFLFIVYMYIGYAFKTTSV